MASTLPGSAIYENRIDRVSIRMAENGNVLVYAKGILITVLTREKLRHLVQLSEQTMRGRGLSSGFGFPNGPTLRREPLGIF